MFEVRTKKVWTFLQDFVSLKINVHPDEVDRPLDYQAMKPYIEIAEKTKADVMKLFEQEMEK